MSEQTARDPVFDLLDTTQRETQDLVGAICQVHSDRVRDLFTRDLRDQVLHILEERFSQLELSLRPRMARARLEVARGITQVLSDCFIRMRKFESDRHWCDALLDATAAMSRRSAFFSVRGENLCFQGVRGFSGMLHAPSSEVPHKNAPAFDRVITAGEMVTAARTAADLSGPLTELFGEDANARVLLVPVSVDSRVPGVIYSEDPVDPSAIQAIATMAGAVLERHLNLVEPPRSSSGAIRAVVVDPDLKEPEPLAHVPVKAPEDGAAVRAKRFARVEIARLLLAHEESVARGRAGADLYTVLRDPIDTARAAYRARFNGTRDYLHEEIVRTLARGNAVLLGGEYPGPLV